MDFMADFEATPMPNVWLGASAEDQTRLDARWPPMAELAGRGWNTWWSLEPLIDEVSFDDCQQDWFESPHCPGWVVVGGESGPKARGMDAAWAGKIRDECRATGTPFFFKQGAQNWGKAFKKFEEFPLSLQVREYPRAMEVADA